MSVGSDALTLVVIVLAALVAFWLIRKIVKLVLSIVIVAVLAAVMVFWCVKAGFFTREDAESLNPLNSEAVREAVRDAGAWAGNQAKEAAKKAIHAAVDETIGGEASAAEPAR